jgi:hypothetical protein
LIDEDAILELKDNMPVERIALKKGLQQVLQQGVKFESCAGSECGGFGELPA